MTELLRRSSLSQRLFFTSLFLIFGFVSVQYTVKVSNADRARSAINRWSSQIQQMEAGEDIHRQHNYPNPPIMAILLWPISELVTLSPILGALTWFYLKAALAVLCVLWVFRLIETPEQPFPAWAKAATVALSVRPILGDLSHGNVNIFILFLVIASLVAFSRGRDVLSGLLLALAIACKVTPALFVGYFVWKRAWRVLGGCGAGLLLFFLGVPALFLGWESNLQALNSWIEGMILPYLANGVVTPEHNNQSLPGLIARLLTVAPSFSTFIGNAYVPLRYDNIADIGPAAAKWLVKAVMGVFALLVIWRCREPISMPGRPTAEVRQGWRLAAEYALISLGMLLFSERTWKHHCVILLLPFAVLCYGVGMQEWSKSTRYVLGALVALAIVLMTTTSTGIYGENLGRLQDQVEATSLVIGPAGVVAAAQSGMFTDSPAKLAQVYGAYVWAFFVLIAGLTIQLRPRDEKSIKASTHDEEMATRRAA